MTNHVINNNNNLNNKRLMVNLIEKDKIWNKIKKYIYLVISLLILLIIILSLILLLTFKSYSNTFMIMKLVSIH